MLTNEYINLFKSNTDAEAVNRGFYYQYLVTLRKWLLNYINKREIFIFCEVDDDIKEVGDKLIFTQVKCYSSNFSLNSSEIKNALFNFFIHFLLNKDSEEIEFCFFTNTGILKSEKLLDAWIKNPDLSDEALFKQVVKKIQEIIKSEINKRKRKKLEKSNLAIEEKKLIKDATFQLKKEIKNLDTNGFVKCLRWVFISTNSIKAVDELFEEVRKLLQNDIFCKKPVKVLESALLSEIFRCSQLPDQRTRVLTNEKIDQILDETEESIASYVDNRFIDLLGVRFAEIDQSFRKVRNIQTGFEKRLDAFGERFESILERTNTDTPKYLTALPNSFTEVQYGRNGLFQLFESKLLEHKCLTINEIGGAGKSFFVQKYINKYKDDYEHIAWIDASPVLSKSLLFNISLVKNLNLQLAPSFTEGAKVDILCNELQQLEGRKILIIDNFEDEVSILQKLISLNDWEIVITSRRILPNIFRFELSRIDLESAINIFRANCPEFSENIERKLYKEFFDYIEYNPLVIKLCAQTISSSANLSLSSLFDSIREQNLDNDELAIEIDLFGEDFPKTILSYLYEKFNLDQLSTPERSIISFLALLPIEDIDLIDMSLIGGEEFKEKNLKEFTNVTNSLHRKGWLEKKGNKVKMYRVVSEIIIYKEREALNSFAPNMMLINWLIHRIDENSQNDPSQSFRFLKYAESILDTIKEKYRNSLYQPLLVLENVLLNSYNWVENSESLHERWVDLIHRAENYIANDDVNLGVMYNNLGFSYSRRGEHALAISSFEKSIKVLKNKESKNFPFLINSINNLAQAFFALNDLKSVKKTLNFSNQKIKKYPNRESQFIAVTHHLWAVLAIKKGDFEVAFMHCEHAIKNHIKVDVGKRNDLLLLIYYSDLIYILFKLSQLDEIGEYVNEINLLINKYKLKYHSLFDDIEEMIQNILAFKKEKF